MNTMVGSIARAAPMYSENSTHPAVTTLRHGRRVNVSTYCRPPFAGESPWPKSRSPTMPQATRCRD